MSFSESNVNVIKIQMKQNEIIQHVAEFCGVIAPSCDLGHLPEITFHPEAAEYGGCAFELNNGSIIFRVTKVTRKKQGEFVTLLAQKSQLWQSQFFMQKTAGLDNYQQMIRLFDKIPKSA